MLEADVRLHHLVTAISVIAELEKHLERAYLDNDVQAAKAALGLFKPTGANAYRIFEESFDYLDAHRDEVEAEMVLVLGPRSKKPARDLKKRLHHIRLGLDPAFFGKDLLKRMGLIMGHLKDAVRTGSFAKFKVEYEELQSLYVDAEGESVKAYKDERELAARIKNRSFQRAWTTSRAFLSRLNKKWAHVAAAAIVAIGVIGVAHQHTMESSGPTIPVAKATTNIKHLKAEIMKRNAQARKAKKPDISKNFQMHLDTYRKQVALLNKNPSPGRSHNIAFYGGLLEGLVTKVNTGTHSANPKVLGQVLDVLYARDFKSLLPRGHVK